MNEISVNELEKLVEECFAQKGKYYAAKELASLEFEKLTQMQEKIIATLESLEMTSYKAKAGTFSYRYQETFQVPKDSESREKFFAYLRGKGVFDTMISVNSKTLNSFAKAEIEAAGISDFQVPGLIKSAPMAIANMRENK